MERMSSDGLVNLKFTNKMSLPSDIEADLEDPKGRVLSS